jgi:hypothetical protein
VPFLDTYKCDAAEHDDACPKWCDLRPGGATKPVPIVAKATTIIPPRVSPERGPASTGGY